MPCEMGARTCEVKCGLTLAPLTAPLFYRTRAATCSGVAMADGPKVKARYGGAKGAPQSGWPKVLSVIALTKLPATVGR